MKYKAGTKLHVCMLSGLALGTFQLSSVCADPFNPPPRLSLVQLLRQHSPIRPFSPSWRMPLSAMQGPCSVVPGEKVGSGGQEVRRCSMSGEALLEAACREDNVALPVGFPLPTPGASGEPPHAAQPSDRARPPSLFSWASGSRQAQSSRMSQDMGNGITCTTQRTP